MTSATSGPDAGAVSLLRTPLYDLHVRLGAKIVPFAGYEMPVNYPAGILKEHLHTRAKAGLFDVSHMGQLTVRAKSGNMRDAALALETIVPIDVVALTPGRQRYAMFTNAEGGILDDLMISHRGDHLLLQRGDGAQVAAKRHHPIGVELHPDSGSHASAVHSSPSSPPRSHSESRQSRPPRAEWAGAPRSMRPTFVPPSRC